MKKFITALTLVAATSFSAMAATVTFPDTLAITGINGDTQFQSQQVTLANGDNFIELRYEDNFPVNAEDSGAWVKSKSLYLLVNLDDKQNYQASIPVINSKYQARNFVKNPVITLKGTQGDSQTVALLNHHQVMAKLLLSQTNNR